MKVFLAILAVICLLGSIGDKIQQNRNNYTLMFIVSIAGIVAIHLIG